MAVRLESLCIAAALADDPSGLLLKCNARFRELIVLLPEEVSDDDPAFENKTTRISATTEEDIYSEKNIWNLLDIEPGFTGEANKYIYQGETLPNKWVRIHLSNVSTDKTKNQLLVQVEDVDETLRAKDEWTFILETSFDGFFDYHIPKDYEYMSPRFWEMFGYAASEKKHKPSEWMGMIHEEDLKSSMEDLGRHFGSKGAVPYVRETRYRHKNGSWVWVLCRGKVVEWGSDGSPLRMVGTHTDITVSKMKEMRERELYAKIEQEHKLVMAANEELRKFVQHVNAPVFGTDTSGIINTWNDRMEKICNIQQETIIGQPLATSAVKNAQQMVQNALEGKEITNALLDVGSEGTVKNLKLLVNTTTRRNLDGTVLGCFCFGLDLTEIQLAQDKLVQERERFTAEKNLNEFVAHEVRNPLAAAISAAQFIEDELRTTDGIAEEEKSALEGDVNVICRSLDYIHQILTSMLDLNKLLEMGVKLVPRSAQLNRDIVEPVYNMYSHRMDTLQLSCDVPEEQLIRVDAVRLKQIIINLTSNAVKFTRVGFVRIKVGRLDLDHPEMLCIFVEDSGPSIPAEKRKFLFEPYVQLSKQVQGSGIGLCLTRHLVEAMNGTINIDDSYNSSIKDSPGTRFVVKIPAPRVKDVVQTDTKGGQVAAGEVPEQLSVVNSIISPSSSRKQNDTDENSANNSQIATDKQSILANFRVLIVDDDRIIRKLLARRFQKIDKSMVVETAESGEKAIGMISGPNAKEYDLVLMDHFMPLCGGELTGEETIPVIRPFIKGIIAGSSGNDMGKEHTAAGADLFWLKPVPKDDILLEDLREAFQLTRLSGSKGS